MSTCGAPRKTDGEPCEFPSADHCPHHGEGGVTTGRPRKQLPDDAAERIEKLAGFGLTQEEIGDLWGLTDRTLRKRLSEDGELSSAYTRGRADYRRSTHKRLRDIAFGRKGELGVEDDVPIGEQRKTLVWIEKSQFGASEKHQLEHSGEIDTGGEVNVYLPSNDRDQLPEAIRERMAGMTGNGAGPE